MIKRSLVSFHIFDFSPIPYVHFYSILGRLFLSRTVSILYSLLEEFWTISHFACFQIRHIYIRLKYNDNSSLILSHYNAVALNAILGENRAELLKITSGNKIFPGVNFQWFSGFSGGVIQIMEHSNHFATEI